MIELLTVDSVETKKRKEKLAKRLTTELCRQGYPATVVSEKVDPKTSNQAEEHLFICVRDEKLAVQLVGSANLSFKIGHRDPKFFENPEDKSFHWYPLTKEIVEIHHLRTDDEHRDHQTGRDQLVYHMAETLFWSMRGISNASAETATYRAMEHQTRVFQAFTAYRKSVGDDVAIFDISNRILSDAIHQIRDNMREASQKYGYEGPNYADITLAEKGFAYLLDNTMSPSYGGPRRNSCLRQDAERYIEHMHELRRKRGW